MLLNAVMKIQGVTRTLSLHSLQPLWIQRSRAGHSFIQRPSEPSQGVHPYLAVAFLAATLDLHGPHHTPQNLIPQAKREEAKYEEARVSGMKKRVGVASSSQGPRLRRDLGFAGISASPGPLIYSNLVFRGERNHYAEGSSLQQIALWQPCALLVL